jgi:hypothetical protein
MKRTLAIGMLSLFAACASLPEKIEQRDFSGTSQMISDGANVNDDSACFSPLAMAAMKGNKELVKMLLDRGADVKARSRECEYVETIGPFKFRLRWGSRTALDRAANAEIARMLIEKGADLRMAGYRQYKAGETDFDSALLNAVKGKNLDLIKVLVEAGASVNQPSEKGKNTLLYWVSGPAYKEIHDYLVSKGAREPELTDAAAAATDSRVRSEYKHMPTGAVTKMSDDIAKAVFDHPERFSGLTINAGDNKTYHYSEFVWTDNGQNVYEWFLLRKKRKGVLKK